MLSYLRHPVEKFGNYHVRRKEVKEMQEYKNRDHAKKIQITNLYIG